MYKCKALPGDDTTAGNTGSGMLKSSMDGFTEEALGLDVNHGQTFAESEG